MNFPRRDIQRNDTSAVVVRAFDHYVLVILNEESKDPYVPPIGRLQGILSLEV